MWISFDDMDWAATKISTRRFTVAVGDGASWNDFPSREFRIRSNTGYAGYVGFLSPEINQNKEIPLNNFFHESILPQYQASITSFKVYASTAESQPSATLEIKTETNSFEYPNFSMMTLSPTSSSQILNITSSAPVSKLVCSSISGSGDKINIYKIEMDVNEPIYDNIFQKSFVVSLNQLLRMYNPSNGLVMNLGWYSNHSDSRVPPLGGGLALALCAAVDMNIVNKHSAKTISHNAIQAFIDAPRLNNMTAHITNASGIVGGSEYSTVDTCLGLISSIIASTYFGFTDHLQTLNQWVSQINFDALTINKKISHGYSSSGSLLPATWDTYGGEEALVQVIQWYKQKRSSENDVIRSAQVYNGTGFIQEIIGLFFSEFSYSTRNDRWGINWKQRRQDLKTLQISNGNSNYFGLSASEILVYDGGGQPLTAYNVVGTSQTDVGYGIWLSPHYALMASSINPAISGNGFEYALNGVQIYESAKVAGLNSSTVERVHTAWSSLNCFFNTISSYHSYNKYINRSDKIYSLASLCFRESLTNYFPLNKKVSK